MGDNDRLVILAEQLNDVDFDVHSQAYKINDMTSFEMKLLFCDDLASAKITCVNKISNNSYYINKHWI